MKSSALAAAFLGIVAMAPASQAAELIMVEQDGCPWCAVWNRDVAPIYAKTAEGKIAPLRRINLHEPLPADLTFIKGLHYTPTFVLVDDGREIGRIAGYPGEDFFWGLLDGLVEKLPGRSTADKAGTTN